VQGQRMNEIMKVLTIVSSIFIPLTFIVGVYGMNFKYMPELEYTYGYYTVVGLMFALAIGLLIFFIKRGWLKRD
jgi:magnesium transporter